MSLFLTTTLKERVTVWRQNTQLLPGWTEEVERSFRKRKRRPLSRELLWGWRLFRASRSYDAVITGYERPAQVFALLQRFCRRRKVPHVYSYVSFNLPAGRLGRPVRRFFIRRLIDEASRIVVHSNHQASQYAQLFRCPASKFEFVPYFSTLFDVAYTTSQGGYIFAGGDYTRDYRTFIEVVRYLPYRVVIAAFYRHYFTGIEIPSNVEIVTTSHEGFNQLIANANLVVVPLRGGLLHPGGHSTFCTAMALGKPVIVTDDTGAADYITHGETGLLVRPGDSDSLRQAIELLMKDPNLARAMGEKARVAAAAFSPERFYARVLALAEECVNGRNA
jgi:glycosyltransferase involved in cell wall biosynthesis